MVLRGWLALGMVLLTLFGLWGCGQDPPIVVGQPQSGLDAAKQILNDYVQGVPMGSEAMVFQEIVEEVRQTDPKKAAILEKGFADLKRAGGNRSAQASQLLKQL